MTNGGLSVLSIGAPEDFGLRAAGGPFTISSAATADAARQHDAVLFHVGSRQALADLLRRADLPTAAFESAVLVLTAESDPDLEIALLRRGVQDVVTSTDPQVVGRAIRHAVERKRMEQAARTAYATDLATGLPHQAQLLEHMTQLLALRERDPAPMVLIVLRIEGLAGAAARLGAEAANVLRRKVAVRLRGSLRASDVVAAIAPDSFGVLLGHVEALSHGERVGSKLARSLQQPFQVAGQPCTVAAAIGLALYPDHGKDAKTLLQRAGAQAASIAAIGREGFASRVERGPTQAANDDGPT